MQESLLPDQELTLLEQESRHYRQANFLKIFLNGFIMLHVVGLLIMLSPPRVSWQNFAIVGLQVSLYVAAWFLNRQKKSQLASHLTCYAFNAQLFYYFFENLLDGRVATATYAANIMSLSSLLAGILISPRAIIAFTALNSLLIGTTFLLLQPTLSESFLSIAFACLIGIISWLYQSTLAKSDSQLESTRLELMRSQVEKATELEALVAERTQELEGTLTDLKKTQKELALALEAAKMASQAKSEFLSNMSHELRTPLNGILGYTQILKRESSLSTSHKNKIGIIHQSGNHLLTLINDILDLSKIEARKMELYPQDIHLASFLNGVIGIMDMKAQEKDVLFVYQADLESYVGDERLPTGIKADEKRLRQVLLNLLGNAVKFTQSGQVMLKVSLLERNQALSRLRFEIIDTGVGMSDEELEKIFLPFEQVGDAKQRAQGTGLGLAITRQLVNLMGGEVQVESKLGKGSRFWFDLSFPVVEVAQREEEVGEERAIRGYKGRRRKVLVVDDKAENRDVLRDLLTPLGFEVYEGEDGKQEVELTRNLKPDLLLTDLKMPIMDGFEAVKAIRLFDSQTPIIAISASVWEAEKLNSLKIGCNAFLPKPVEAQKLLALIEKHLQIEWLYEESTSEEKVVEEQTLIPPPRQQLEALYEAATLGMMSQIRKQMDELEQLDAKYAPFANKLRELARGFEDEKIVTLVEEHL